MELFCNHHYLLLQDFSVFSIFIREKTQLFWLLVWTWGLLSVSGEGPLLTVFSLHSLCVCATGPGLTDMQEMGCLPSGSLDSIKGNGRKAYKLYNWMWTNCSLRPLSWEGVQCWGPVGSAELWRPSQHWACSRPLASARVCLAQTHAASWPQVVEETLCHDKIKDGLWGS